MKDSSNSPDGGQGRAPDATSASLLERVKRREAAGWEELVYLYTPLVRWWGRRQGVRDQDVEEVVQKVFLTVHRKADKLYAGAFRCWLRETTRFKCLEILKEQRRQPQAEGGSTAQRELQNVADAPNSDSEAPDHDTELAILLRRVFDLVRGNSEAKRWDAARRILIDGQSVKEVAAALGMTEVAVRTAKSRVLAAIRKKLKEAGEDPPLPAC